MHQILKKLLKEFQFFFFERPELFNSSGTSPNEIQEDKAWTGREKRLLDVFKPAILLSID